MKKASVRVVIALLITLVLAIAYFYVVLPALNVFDQGFWIFVFLCVACFCVVFSLLSISSGVSLFTKSSDKRGGIKLFSFSGSVVLKVGVVLAIIPIAVMLLGNLFSSEFFHAEKYSSIIDVPEAVFEEDMPETAVVSNIALMDSETAQKMGDRTLGALSDVVSQYEINSTYRQINYNNTPQKVSNLEYADFFRWLRDRATVSP